MGLDAQIAARLDLAGTFCAMAVVPAEDLSNLSIEELVRKMETARRVIEKTRPAAPVLEPPAPELTPEQRYAAALAARNRNGREV